MQINTRHLRIFGFENMCTCASSPTIYTLGLGQMQSWQVNIAGLSRSLRGFDQTMEVHDVSMFHFLKYM